MMRIVITLCLYLFGSVRASNTTDRKYGNIGERLLVAESTRYYTLRRRLGSSKQKCPECNRTLSFNKKKQKYKGSHKKTCTKQCNCKRKILGEAEHKTTCPKHHYYWTLTFQETVNNLKKVSTMDANFKTIVVDIKNETEEGRRNGKIFAHKHQMKSNIKLNMDALAERKSNIDQHRNKVLQWRRANRGKCVPLEVRSGNAPANKGLNWDVQNNHLTEGMSPDEIKKMENITQDDVNKRRKERRKRTKKGVQFKEEIIQPETPTEWEPEKRPKREARRHSINNRFIKGHTKGPSGLEELRYYDPYSTVATEAKLHKRLGASKRKRSSAFARSSRSSSTSTSRPRRSSSRRSRSNSRISRP